MENSIFTGLSDTALNALLSIKDELPDIPAIEDEFSLDDDMFLSEITPERQGAVTVVSLAAYLMGVQEKHFGADFRRDTFDDLQKEDDARIIRSLCRIRNGIMGSIGTITTRLRTELCSIDTMPDLVDSDAFAWLDGRGIRIVRGAKPKDPMEYVQIVNGIISERIGNCKRFLPIWVNWDYFKALFTCPKGANKPAELKSQANVFKTERNKYPYGCWIDWPVHRSAAIVPDPENYLPEALPDHVNILVNDRKFLIMLYHVNGDEFTDLNRVRDVSAGTNDCICEFLAEADHVTVLVDCENSDPYKLCSALQHIKTVCAERGIDGYSHIDRILLFDDVHTVDAWDVLQYYTDIDLHHEEVERVLGSKSLVDIAMTAGACREHYVNGTNAFLLASSDSDFWGLMRAMPECSFYVLGERGKLSDTAKQHYAEHDISCAYMDDFGGDLQEIKQGAMRAGMEQYMQRRIMVNLYDMFGELHDALRLDMSERERDRFLEDTLKRMRVTVAPDGELSLQIAE